MTAQTRGEELSAQQFNAGLAGGLTTQEAMINQALATEASRLGFQEQLAGKELQIGNILRNVDQFMQEGALRQGAAGAGVPALNTMLSQLAGQYGMAANAGQSDVTNQLALFEQLMGVYGPWILPSRTAMMPAIFPQQYEFTGGNGLGISA